ncbi:MAG TPA: Rossmann-like and DUF2520 domain-containing protein [Terriglobales bacterium]|jgi:predicted short-subunit dehydrogenase-like oxidoreductase (DUF2520 family)|nr:Rossmann-like and DUF2520 domain-containing protein [Terriglobales bacterium]
MSRKPTIALVGAGRVAQALGPALRQAGYRILEVVGRDRTSSRDRARRLARRVGARATTMADAELHAGLIWLAVSDDAVAACARALAQRTDWEGKIALHSSGALPSDQLGPLRRRGAAVASLHPLMTFARPAPELRGASFAVEGDARAVPVARRIARDLGGSPLLLRKKDKALYHAWGMFTSPLLVAVLALGECVGRKAGVPDPARAAQAILRQTFRNYLEAGAAAAFSGPLVRGDVATVRANLRALRSVPEARQAYLALARAALHNLPSRNGRELMKLLK